MKTITSQDLLTVLPKVKSVGFPMLPLTSNGTTRNLRFQIFTCKFNGNKYLRVRDFRKHYCSKSSKLPGRSPKGRCEFLFTPEGMRDLDNYIKFWFGKKNQAYLQRRRAQIMSSKPA